MSNNTAPITRKGLEKVQAELDHLIKVEREDLKKIIQEARELGDLKENAEYHAAKEKQSLTEGRIQQLQSIVARSQVIDPGKIKSDKIVFGATVVLIDTEKNQTLVYQIVGEEETDAHKGRISYTSPLGKALIGKEQGDEVIVRAPKGEINYEIESFEFKD